MTRKRDYASLTGIGLSPQGGVVEEPRRRSDLSDLLLLAPDRTEIAELAPEIAAPADPLVADLDAAPARSGASFFTTCARRIRRFVASRSATST